MNVLFAATILSLLLATTGGFAQEEDTTCGEEMTTNNQICDELFQALQASLVTNRANLYNLRKIFFPSSKPSPTLLNVSYELAFKDVLQIPCSDANETINASEILRSNYGWTSNTIYTTFHPATLNRLQPQIFYMMMVKFEPSTSGTALPWEGVNKFLTLHLFLDIKKLSCLPSREQIDGTLTDLTSVLKVYARDQKNLTEWASQDSHVLDGRVFDGDWREYECEIYGILGCYIRTINYVFALFLTLIASVAIMAVVKFKGPKKGYKPKQLQVSKQKRDELKKSDCDIWCCYGGVGKGKKCALKKAEKGDARYDFYHSLLWSATGVLLLWCVVLYLADVVILFRWSVQMSTALTDLEAALNFIWLITLVFIVTLVGCCFNFCTTIDILSPSHTLCSAPCCGCPFDSIFCIIYRTCICNDHCCQSLKNYEEKIDNCLANLRKEKGARKAVGAIPLMVLFLSTGFVVLNTVPIILYFLLHPIRVLSFYTYILAALVFIIFVLTEVDYERRTNKHESDERLIEREIKRRKKMKEKKARQQRTCAEEAQLREVTREEDDDLENIKEGLYKLRQKFDCSSSDWLQDHFLVYVPMFALLFLGIVTVLFALTYRTIVAQGSTGNTLYNIFRALIPALLLGSPSVWIGKRLKRHYHLCKEEEKKSSNNSGSEDHSTPANNDSTLPSVPTAAGQMESEV